MALVWRKAGSRGGHGISARSGGDRHEQVVNYGNDSDSGLGDVIDATT